MKVLFKQTFLVFFFFVSIPLNFINVMGIVLKIIEIFSIATLAFAPYIDWGFS